MHQCRGVSSALLFSSTRSIPRKPNPTTTFISKRNDDDGDDDDDGHDECSALRELDRQNVVKSDPFILMQGDVVSNVDLRAAMEGHAHRRKKDAAAIMTILLQEVGGWGLDGGEDGGHNCGCVGDGDFRVGGAGGDGDERKGEDGSADPAGRRAAVRGDHCLPPLRSSTDDLLLALDATHSNRILLWDDHASAARRRDARHCHIPAVFFQENSSNITLTRDYLDVGIDVCSPDVLARFSDEFDYRELRTQFVSNCVSEEESGLQSGRIYAHVMDRGEYAGRPLGDMRRYHRVSMDLLRRWCYPLVPDNYGGSASNGDAASYVCERHLVYRDVGGSDNGRGRNRSHVGRSTQLLGTLLLGPNYSIGERCRLQRSVLGPNCTLMDDCTIVDSHLWGNVLIESGAHLSGVIVCEGAVVRRGAVLERGCVVGSGCVVGQGVRLREFTRITCAAVEVEDDDDYSGFDDSSSGEDDPSSEDSSDCDGKEGDEEALVDTTATIASLKIADTNSNHDVVGKDGIGRVYVPSPPDDYDSDDDEGTARAAMELMKSQSIGYDMTLVYRKWQKLQMEDEDDGFSLDEMGSDDDDDMDMRDEWMNESGEATAAAGRNMHASASTSQFGDGGVQITGRQKGVDVVKELRDICLEHETSSPVENLRIELNSFKFSQNATYGDCCRGAMMAVMEKIVDESGENALTPGKLVGSLRKMMEYWGSLFQSICIGSEEEKSIIHSLESMALGHVGSKFVSVLGTEPAFRFVLQTLHDQEIVNEEAIFEWALERKEEGKDSPLGELFWQKPTQDFLEWLREDSGSDDDDDNDDGDGSTDEESD